GSMCGSGVATAALVADESVCGLSTGARFVDSSARPNVRTETITTAAAIHFQFQFLIPLATSSNLGTEAPGVGCCLPDSTVAIQRSCSARCAGSESTAYDLVRIASIRVISASPAFAPGSYLPSYFV